MIKRALSRRDFLKGAAAGAVSIAVLGVAGCGDSGGSGTASPGGGSETTASPSNIPEITASPSGGSRIPDNISETIDCDIAVIGAGNSGLAATVQAAELGAKVILLEVNDAHGVNTEGLFAVGSHYQQEQGISVSMKEILSSETAFFNYRINSLF